MFSIFCKTREFDKKLARVAEEMRIYRESPSYLDDPDAAEAYWAKYKDWIAAGIE